MALSEDWIDVSVKENSGKTARSDLSCVCVCVVCVCVCVPLDFFERLIVALLCLDSRRKRV